MPRLYHAKGATEYHSREICPVGSKIAEDIQEDGTGGGKLCDHCAEQDRRDARSLGIRTPTLGKKPPKKDKDQA
jgi:hypothetical protein